MLITAVILVCSGTGCIATGSEKIYKKMLGIAEGAPGVTIEIWTT